MLVWMPTTLLQIGLMQQRDHSPGVILFGCIGPSCLTGLTTVRKASATTWSNSFSVSYVNSGGTVINLCAALGERRASSKIAGILARSSLTFSLTNLAMKSSGPIGAPATMKPRLVTFMHGLSVPS